MNIGTRLILSAALAVGSTIGAAALGQTSLRDSPADVAPPTAEGDRATPDARAATAGTTDEFGSYPGLTDAERLHTATAGAADTTIAHAASADAAAIDAAPLDAGARADGVRAELLSAAEAGEISWAAAERVSEDLGAYIRGERRADVV
ncbi:hypothetical protein [Brevibacterium yomogidense]|uniref:hypothetical protein n=1 Tax=Brevibacterium yomogidense TaxID=946573 RepID=UPI0018E01F03|nr:hypothetical protein [Brevibacterium yomogidense]